MKPSLLGDHRTDALVDRLGIALPHAIGIMELIWIDIQRQANKDDQVDGVLRNATATSLAKVCRWNGDPKQLLDALLDDGDGWLFVDTDGNLCARDWGAIRPRHLNLRASRSKPAPPKPTPSASMTLIPEEDLTPNHKRRWATKDLDLDRIYQAYPRKEKPKAAKAAIERAVRAVSQRESMTPAEAADWMHARVVAYADSPMVATTPRHYIPHPTSWFNAGRFDEPDEAWQQERGGDSRATATERTTRNIEHAAAKSKEVLDALYGDDKGGGAAGAPALGGGVSERGLHGLPTRGDDRTPARPQRGGDRQGDQGTLQAG